MKKIIFTSIIFLLAFFITGCTPKTQKTPTMKNDDVAAEKKVADEELQQEKNQPKTTADNKTDNWTVYKNSKHGYQLKYPDNWFFLEDACCPPPPTGVNFNNFSSKKIEYSKAQMNEEVMGLNIMCGYENAIDDIGEVQLYLDEGAENKRLKINGFNAIKIQKEVVPGNPSKMAVSYYIVGEKEGCRLNFTSDCNECKNIISSFSY
ncbi:MAG: hypothetical protein U9M90_00120 [Patescibacteria group bacterium]|nr:hypothetical protein [Patescibacteria group bacterium]